MRVSIYKLKSLMKRVLLEQGMNQNEIELVVDQYWEAEIRGKKTHGIGKFCWEFQHFSEREGSPEIVIDKGSIVLVDAHKEIGQLAAKFCTDLVILRAKKYGVALVGMKNARQYGTLDTWVRMIADKDLIGIVVNSCQPATAVYGGVSKILGTNPIAGGIPTSAKPIILDMATSKVAMSLIWQALRENKKLPKKTFFDHNGNYTTNPLDAKAVEIFGGYKGYGLSLLIQILSGSLITAKMGFEIKNAYNIGYYFQALDPSVFQPIDSFKKQNDLLITQIRLSKKKKGVDKILIPGERSEKIKRRVLSNGYINLPDKTWNLLINLTKHKKTYGKKK